LNSAATMLTLIRIHPLLWLAAAAAALTGHFLELCMLFAIILIHEVGHAAAALSFSWRIKKITLLPFGGVAEMDEHGNRPVREELIVILAGPAQHLWLMGAAFLMYENGVIPEYAYFLFMKYNLMILVFNLFPIWPLDGGKLLFLLLSLWKPFPDAYEWMLISSFVFLTLFTATALIVSPFHLNSWLIAGFLYFSLFFEWKQRHFVFMRFLLERYYGNKESVPPVLKPIRADEGEAVMKVLAKFRRGCKHPILVESRGKEKGMLDENEVLHYVFAEKRPDGKVGDLIYAY